MSITVDWHELSVQLVITLAHFLWQAVVVAGLWVIVERTLMSLHRRDGRSGAPAKGAGSNVRYASATLAFLALPTCVLATYTFVHASRGPILQTASKPTATPAHTPIAFAAPPNATNLHAPVTTHGEVVALAADEPLTQSPTPLGGINNSPHGNDSDPAFSATLGWLSPYLISVYLLGVSLMLARFGISILGSGRLRRTRQPIDDPKLRSLIEQQSARLGLRRLPLVAICRRVSVPMVVGIIKPVILLPPALICNFDPNHLAAILRHEMAHIRRYDLLVNLLQRIVEAVLFFHPVTWWISHRISVERENCCDDLAALECGRLHYATALLRMAERCALVRGINIDPQLASLAADGQSVSMLSYRIRRLLGEPDSPRVAFSRGALVLLTLTLLVGTASTFAYAPPRNSDSDQPPENGAETTAADDKQDAGVLADWQADQMDDKLVRRAGRFVGIVTGPDGQRLAGASVYVVSNQGDANHLGSVRATTDQEGRFEFDAADMTYPGYDGLPRRYEGLVLAKAKGLAPDWMETWGDNTSRLREYWTPRRGEEIQLQLARDDVPIRGRFLDADGNPLAGARVRLKGLMVPRDRDLTAHLEHWSKASVSAGFLTKVPDYKRELLRTELLPDVNTVTHTDAEGRFELTGLGRDRLARIEVTAPTVLDTTIEVMTRRAENVGTFLDFNQKPTQMVYGADFTLQLRRGLTITGMVRDRDTKEPIQGMWITKYYNPLTHPRFTRGVTVSDSDGRFTLSGLDPGLLEYEEKHRRLTAIAQPGVPYLMARSVIEKDAKVVFECVRGIAYRLKLVDDKGQPVEATVEYRTISPNPLSQDLVAPLLVGSNWPVMNRAAAREAGIYEGFVLPGPGAVMVGAANSRDFRPALVDPKAFFEPGRTQWPEPADSIYGTRDRLRTIGGWFDQNKYDAIVLVNPMKGAEPLELSATVVHDQPRLVKLVDELGEPVVGVDSRMQWPGRETQWPGRETKEMLNSDTFYVRGLHPDRVKRMTFFKADRRLIGILEARGDSDAPYEVVMKPWSRLEGRVVDRQGAAVKANVWLANESAKTRTNDQGRFLLDRLVPDQPQDILIKPAGDTTITRLEDVVFPAGKTLNLGDIQLTGEDTSNEN
ncbi:MAG: M56 family metallopeptidase [Pirellulales bacterium]|nr:M56 family metallopeptidase [Pirellulales bacterium]